MKLCGAILNPCPDPRYLVGSVLQVIPSTGVKRKKGSWQAEMGQKQNLLFVSSISNPVHITWL